MHGCTGGFAGSEETGDDRVLAVLVGDDLIKDEFNQTLNITTKSLVNQDTFIQYFVKLKRNKLTKVLMNDVEKFQACSLQIL